MATFEPGHLHVERHALNKDDYSYNLCIDYEVSQDPKEGKGMLFKLHGSVQGQDLKEEFFLPKDQAFDFARHAEDGRTQWLNAQAVRPDVRGRAASVGREIGRSGQTRTPGIIRSR
jgi:hypothetical protein